MLLLTWKREERKVENKFESWRFLHLAEGYVNDATQIMQPIGYHQYLLSGIIGLKHKQMEDYTWILHLYVLGPAVHYEFVTRWRLKRTILQNLKTKLGNQRFGDQMCRDFSSHCCVFKITLLSMMILPKNPRWGCAPKQNTYFICYSSSLRGEIEVEEYEA